MKEIKTIAKTQFISLYDLQYEEKQHYYVATRRDQKDLVATKDEESFKEMLPDAVSAFLIIEISNEEPRLLMTYEFRYPIGRYVLSIPSGLIDPADKESDNPLITAIKREIREETGLKLKPTDGIKVDQRILFCSPGLTDESTGTVGIVAHLDDLSALSQKGANGGEKFSGFVLATKKEVRDILDQSYDKHSHYYPMVTYAAMRYFLSDVWKEI